ncbi:MAG: hypothetical protein MUF71_02150 [Candidatus Kapabacteria bacterium]|jgi:hypothetical protein|nr:hypothetical protein [Candidatus Kapabacteria bacterium]
MRKLFAVVIVGAILSFASVQTTQAQVLKKGTSIVDAGLGLGWAISPFVGYEYGLTDKIGVGRFGLGGTVSAALYSGGTWLTIGPEVRYHFDFGTFPPKDWDLFAGLGLYYYNWLGYSGDYTPLYFGYHIGGRYYFSEKLGATVLLGGGGGFGVSIGISFKL